MKLKNILKIIPDELPEELFDTLVSYPHFKIERIVSFGHATPAGQWLSQETDEWVAVLKGQAELAFRDAPSSVIMEEGDSLNIPAGRVHRVEKTQPGVQTIWLAVHYRP